MNKKSLGSFAICIIAALSISGCKKEIPGPIGATGAAGPSLSGNIKGYVFLFDEYGSPILTGLSGLHDSIDGTSNVAITDSAGFYTFNNLSTGIYNFTLMNPGFGTEKVQNQQFVGGGTLNRDLRLSKIPPFSPSSITAVASATDVTITGTVTADTRVRTFIVFAGSNSSTSSSPSNYLDFYTKNVPSGATTFNIVIPNSDLYNLGLTTGTTAYFASYGAASGYNSTSNYEDLATGRTTFNALSAAYSSVNVVVQ